MKALKLQFIAALATVFACLLTLILQRLGIHPVPASAVATLLIVGTLSGLNTGGQCGPAIFCGSFAGMSLLPELLLGPEIGLSALPVMTFAFLLSAAVAALYLGIHALSERFPNALLNGYGGKLGAIAFLATLLLVLSVRVISGTLWNPQLTWSSLLTIQQGDLINGGIALSILAGAVGAVVPLMILGKGLYNLTANARVMVTALCGLCGGGVLLLLPTHGPILAGAWYAGILVSMTAREVISPPSYLMLAGSLSSLLLVIFSELFHGFGGVKGLSAFLAVIVIYRLEPIRLHLANKYLPDKS